MRTIVEYKAIGTIRSEHLVPSETPIQPCFAKGCKGRVELLPQFEEGLKDIEGFSHIILLYHLHQTGPMRMLVKPFLEEQEHGVFATRHPRRPNPIGMSVVRLAGRQGNTLLIEDVDILEGTPLLDIKPYISRFDRIETTRNGWQDDVGEETAGRLGRRGYRQGESGG